MNLIRGSNPQFQKRRKVQRLWNKERKVVKNTLGILKAIETYEQAVECDVEGPGCAGHTGGVQAP